MFSSKGPISASDDLRVSSLESNHRELRELLNSVPKISEVKDLFDSFKQHHEECLRQHQQETIRHREQQQQQMQLHQSLLQQQQHLLEHQQQHLIRQQFQLEQIALHQQSHAFSQTNLDITVPSAPPLSVERDE